jgi:cell division protein FtsI (penicillin-binding protein 3)
MAEANEGPVMPAAVKPGAIGAQVVPAAMTARDADHQAVGSLTTAAASSAGALSSVTRSENSPAQKSPTSGTVVLDVEEGGIAVPSFLGKNLRVAIEAAQDAGLDLDAIGSGVAREQTPLPGAHVAAGSRVVVKFGR